MSRKKNMTEGEYIMKLIDEGAPFEDQCTYQLSIGNIKLKVDKEQNDLDKDIGK